MKYLIFAVVVDHARNPKASTGKFELIYKDRQPGKICMDKYLAVNGMNYFTKYKTADGLETDEEKKKWSPHSGTPNFESGIIKSILNIDPEQVKNDVKHTLEKILAIIHDEREKRIADKHQREFQSATFKNMLSEFVSIISSRASPTEKSDVI